MSPRPLNATAASLLGFLHEGPMTGWDLVAVAEQRIGDFWTLTQSQVYRELAAMARTGLVEAGPPGPRDRKPYRITEAGRTAFKEWIDRVPGQEQIRFPLLLTIMFAGHLAPERLAEMIASHRAVHAERLAEYRRVHAALEAMADTGQDRETQGPTRPAVGTGRPGDADRYRLITLEFGLLHESAVLEWFDRLPTMLGPS